MAAGLGITSWPPGPGTLAALSYYLLSKKRETNSPPRPFPGSAVAHLFPYMYSVGQMQALAKPPAPLFAASIGSLSDIPSCFFLPWPAHNMEKKYSKEPTENTLFGGTSQRAVPKTRAPSQPFSALMPCCSPIPLGGSCLPPVGLPIFLGST